jgi:hypothetical protein
MGEPTMKQKKSQTEEIEKQMKRKRKPKPFNPVLGYHSPTKSGDSEHLNLITQVFSIFIQRSSFYRS